MRPRLRRRGIFVAYLKKCLKNIYKKYFQKKKNKVDFSFLRAILVYVRGEEKEKKVDGLFSKEKWTQRSLPYHEVFSPPQYAGRLIQTLNRSAFLPG